MACKGNLSGDDILCALLLRLQLSRAFLFTSYCSSAWATRIIHACVRNWCVEH